MDMADSITIGLPFVTEANFLNAKLQTCFTFMLNTHGVPITSNNKVCREVPCVKVDFELVG